MKIVLFLIMACTFTMNVWAQEESEVQNVIETLFDGMRDGDSAKVSSTFHPDAIMETVSMNKEGIVIKNTGSLNVFLNAVGTPHDEVWDEQISSYKISIDGELASAWTPYKFFVGEKFSHCGVNSFQLAKLNEQWQIIYIVDTRRRTDCVE